MADELPQTFWRYCCGLLDQNLRLILPMVMVGQKMPGGAEREVGATSTVESSRSSDWTMTPYLAPRCSLPRAPRSGWTSPRTQLVHLGEYLSTLGDVGWVAGDLQRLSTHLFPSPQPNGIDQHPPDRVGHGRIASDTVEPSAVNSATRARLVRPF